jgi:hypothetical protein
MKPSLLTLGLAAAAGGALAGLAAAAIDAHFAWHAASGGAGSLLALLLADAGVIAPLGLVVGATAGVGAAVLSPSGRFVPRALFVGFESVSREERVGRSAAVASVTLSGFLSLIALAHAARDALGSSAPPRVTGALLAVHAALLGLGMAAVATVAADRRAKAGSGLPRAR